MAQKTPLLNLENILYFGYKGASPTLLGECAKRKIGFCFLNQNGKFLARVCGASYGNVFLRKEQYRLSDDEKGRVVSLQNTCLLERYIIVVQRLCVHCGIIQCLSTRNVFREVIGSLKQSVGKVQRAENLEELRGIEGNKRNFIFRFLMI